MIHQYVDAASGKEIDAPTKRGISFLVPVDGKPDVHIIFEYVDNVFVTDYKTIHFITTRLIREDEDA